MSNTSSDRTVITNDIRQISKQLFWWKVAAVIAYFLTFLLPASFINLNAFYSFFIFGLAFLSSNPGLVFFQIFVYVSLLFIVPLYITNTIRVLHTKISYSSSSWTQPVYIVVFVAILWTAGSAAGTLPGSPLNGLLIHQKEKLSEEKISNRAKEGFESIQMLLATFYIYEREYPANLIQLTVKIPDASKLLGTDLLSSQSLSYTVTPDKMSYSLCIGGVNTANITCSTPTFESKQKRDEKRKLELRYLIAEIYNNGFSSSPPKSFKPILDATKLLPTGVIGYESTSTGFKYCVRYELLEEECITETSELTVQFRDYARQRRLFEIISYLKEYHDLSPDTRLRDIEITGRPADNDIFSPARKGYSLTYDGTEYSGRTNTFVVCVDYESIGNTCIESWNRIRHIPEFFK